jgi:hypothetical protein
MLNVIMLSDVVLSVIMLSVLAPLSMPVAFVVNLLTPNSYKGLFHAKLGQF